MSLRGVKQKSVRKFLLEFRRKKKEQSVRNKNIIPTSVGTGTQLEIKLERYNAGTER